MKIEDMQLLQIGDLVWLREKGVAGNVVKVSTIGVTVDGYVSHWSHTDIDRIPLTAEQLEANASRYNDSLFGKGGVMYHYDERTWVQAFENGRIYHDGIRVKYTDELQRSLRRRGLVVIANRWVLTKEEGDSMKQLGVIARR